MAIYKEPKNTSVDSHIKRLFNTGDFSDFLVHAQSTGTPTETTVTFKVHRSVLSRSDYFASCFRGIFEETSTGSITLPEPFTVVEYVLKKLYRFTSTDLLAALNSMSPYELVMLYGAADKYVVEDIKSDALDSWFLRFDRVHIWLEWVWTEDEEDGELLKLSSALDSLHQSVGEVNLTRFDERLWPILEMMYHRCDRRVCRIAYAAYPSLLAQVAVELERKSGPSGMFRSQCPDCSKEWSWSEIKESNLACPVCGSRHAWEAYVVHCYVERYRAEAVSLPAEIAVKCEELSLPAM